MFENARKFIFTLKYEDIVEEYEEIYIDDFEYGVKSQYV